MANSDMSGSHPNSTNAPAFLLESVDDSIGWISFNRPEFRNAISKSMWDELPRALVRSQKAGARLIVFRGQGGAFASGADLSELAQLRDVVQAAELWNSIRLALNTVARFELPTIAMIAGPCMGGGCLLAAACDLRYAEPSARFSVPVAQLGILLDEDNIGRLISLVGRGIASELLFASAILSADRAERTGLVNMVVPTDELLRSVMKAADQIKSNSGPAIGLLKQSVARICARGAQPEDQSEVVGSYLSEDFRQRVAIALSGKRPGGGLL